MVVAGGAEAEGVGSSWKVSGLAIISGVAADVVVWRQQHC